MARLIPIVDLIVILVILWLGVHVCLWGYKQFKKEEKK